MRKKVFSKKMCTKGIGNQSLLKSRAYVYVGLLIIMMLILVSFGGKLPPVLTSTALAGTSTFDDAASEAYWYSKYNLVHMVIRSGMGIQFMYSKEQVMKMIELAG